MFTLPTNDPPDTYLRLNDVVRYDGRVCFVAKINDCRAVVVPISKRVQTFTPQTGVNAGKPVTLASTEAGDGISPNSPLDILGTYNPATRSVKWRNNADAECVPPSTLNVESLNVPSPALQPSEPTLQQTELL
jgi:hypothetical protein